MLKTWNTLWVFRYAKNKLIKEYIFRWFFSQAYMQAKSKGAPVVEDPDPKGLRAPERRIDIQPAEDEEDPGTFIRSNLINFICVGCTGI